MPSCFLLPIVRLPLNADFSPTHSFPSYIRGEDDARPSLTILFLSFPTFRTTILTVLTMVSTKISSEKPAKKSTFSMHFPTTLHEDRL